AGAKAGSVEGGRDVDETSTIDGKREDPGALRWKQTSMSYEAAVNKYGADHVRKEGKNRAGQEVIAVHVPLGEQAVLEGNNDEYNDESGMAYNSLRTIHRATKGLANTIKDGDNLPEWCQEKISLAEDYLVTVWDYLQSEKGLAEGLGYSQDPAQAKWYHEGRMAFKGGTTGNTIQGIAKKHGCPSEWIDAFHAGYQDQEGFSKDSVAEVSDPSGMMHAAQHYNKSFIITAELAEGGTKKYRIHAQSERVAREKFSQHYNMAKVLNVEEEGVAEGLNEFAADDGDSGGEDDALHKYARMWWAGDEVTQMQIEKVLARMGWEIGEDEGGYDNGGVFVVRAGDVNGNSYVSWPAEDLTEGVAEGETTLTKTGRIHRSTDAYGGSPPEPDPIGDELDKSGTRRIDRALGVQFKPKGYQKDTNTVSEAPGDKGSSREHLAMLRAEKKEHEQAQRAKQEKMDRNLKNYQAGDVRASDIKVAEASKTRNPTTDFLRKHPVPDSEMVTLVKNKDADASFKNMMGGSSNELTKNLKIKEQESTPGDEHTRRQKLIKYLAKHKGWDRSDLEHATTKELIQYYKECRQGMAEGKDPTTDAAQEAYGFQRGEVKKNKDGSYVATNHAGSRKIFKSEKAAKAHADSGSQGMSEGSVNEVSVDTLSSYGKKAIKSAAKNADLSGQYQEKAFDKYNKGGAAADRSWDDLDKAKKYAAKADRRNAGADLAAVKLGKKFSKGMSEARTVDDLKDELTSWKKEGPWTPVDPNKDPKGKVHNLAGKALKKTKELNPTTKKV
ncbi:MAG: hypothetical protein EBU33_01415, partial [Sphingobacteriia bacterium]|nr:hypothetical protein [Sphingobacteriia bacterium]